MQKATYRQAQQVLKLVGQQDLSGPQLQQLLISGLFTDVLEAAAAEGFSGLHRDTVRVALGLPKLTPDPDIIELGELMVTEKATIEEMTRAGEYDGYQPNIDLICKNFSITRRGPRELYLAHFKKEMSNDELDKAIAAMGDKEDAPAEYLLAVGAHPKHRELQRQFPIIARGSSAVVLGYRGVPCLYGRGARRDLRLHWGGGDWDGVCRFLLVRKSS